MVMRQDVPLEWSETETPAYFGFHHGRLVVRGLGKFLPTDEEEPIANFKPFLEELAGQKVRAVYVKIVAFPPGVNTQAVQGVTKTFYQVGWFSWIGEDNDNHNGLLGRQFINFTENVFVSPNPNVVEYRVEAEAGYDFLVIPFWLGEEPATP